MFFKGIAIFLSSYENIDVELINQRGWTNSTFGSPSFLYVLNFSFLSIRRKAYCSSEQSLLLLSRKDITMLTREEILTIEDYYAEHKLTHNAR